VLNQAGDGQQQGQPAGTPKRPAGGKQRFLFLASNPEYGTYLDMGTITLIHNRDNDTYRFEFWAKNIYNQAGKAGIIAVKTKEGKGERFFDFNSTLTQLRVNLTTEKFAILRLIYYDDTGKVIETADYTRLPPHEEKIVPGSLIAKAVDLITRLVKEHPGMVNMVSE